MNTQQSKKECDCKNKVCVIAGMGLGCQCKCHHRPSPAEEVEWKERMDCLLYDFADNVTDREGMVDSKNTKDFQSNADVVEDFISSIEHQSYQKGYKVGWNHGINGTIVTEDSLSDSSERGK